MHSAAEKGHDIVVNILISHEADVNAVTVVSMNQGVSYYVCIILNVLLYRKNSLLYILLLNMVMLWWQRL